MTNVRSLIVLVGYTALNFTSCKTVEAPHEMSASVPTKSDLHYEISCSIQVPASQKSISIALRPAALSETNYGTVVTFETFSPDGVVSEHNEQLLADQDLRTNDTVLLHWNETSFKIDFVQSHAKAPLVSSEGQSGSCVRLFASPSRNVTAHCNAKGTPAQGWYANGKLIQYDTECDSSTLACGVLGQEGWFAQEKQNRSAVQYERCSWQTQLPVCKENQQGLGWYLDNRLVAKDHDCRKKAIECGTINGHEAWVAYVRSAPKLYSAQSCIEAVKQELQKAPRNRSDIAKR